MMQQAEFEELFTVKDVARIFHVDKSTIYAWMQKNLIRYVTLPGQRKRIKPSEVRRILDQ